MGPCPLGLLSPLNHQFLVVQPVLSMEIKFPISSDSSAAAEAKVPASSNVISACRQWRELFDIGSVALG